MASFTPQQIGARFRQRVKDPAQFAKYSDEELGQRLIKRSPQLQAAVGATTADPTAPEQPKAGPEQAPAPGLLEKAKKAVQAIFGAKKDFDIGMVKALGTSLVNIGNVGADAFDALISKATGMKKTSSVIKPLSTDPLKPKNTAEKAGFATERVAEFLVPVGGEVKAAVGAGKLARAGAGALNIARDVTQAGLLTAGQTGDLKQAGTVAGATAIISPVAAKAFPALSAYLQKSSLRLTPAMKEKLGQKVGQVVDFLTEKKIVGTPAGRVEKVSNLINKTEGKLQAFLEGPAKKVSASKNDVVAAISKIKDEYKGVRDSGAISRQIDEAIKNIQTDFGDKISMAQLNKFKRSVYDGAYNKAGDKVLDDVEHRIGDVVRETIETRLDKAAAGKPLKIDGKLIGDFNKEYGTMLNAKKLLKTASTRAQAGFLAKLVSSIAGSSLGGMLGPAGSAVGAVVAPGITEALAGGLARSATAVGLKAASKLPKAGVGRSVVELKKLLFPD